MNENENVEAKELKKFEKQSKSKEGLVIGIIIALVVLIALAIFGYFLYNKNLKAVVKFDTGVVNVDDFEIYYRTFAPMLQYVYGYTNDDADALGEIIAQKAASDMILVSRAKAAGITISAEDKEYVDGIFSDEEELQIFIDAGINPTRMKEFYYNDFIMDDYREYLAEQLPDDEVESYIKENYGEDTDMREYVTKHILFKASDSEGNALSDEEKAAKKEQAQAVLERALAGEDFSSLAKEYSEDKGTAEKGGEYKVYMDGTTDSDYSNAAITLDVGAVTSELVETQFGYHIIKLEEYNENGKVHQLSVREEMVSDDLSKVTDEEHVEIQTEVMKEVIAKVTGNPISSDLEAVTSTEQVSEDDGVISLDDVEETESTSANDTESTENTNAEVQDNTSETENVEQ
ncbi:MAG: peptidylprolyl isomerase [Clostridia bacterium]|nr:peptidylprolyl isomerase [Clostridia bacterium]